MELADIRKPTATSAIFGIFPQMHERTWGDIVPFGKLSSLLTNESLGTKAVLMVKPTGVSIEKARNRQENAM